MRPSGTRQRPCDVDEFTPKHRQTNFKNEAVFPSSSGKRLVTALIARRITGAKKGKPFGRFWQGLAYTRVLMSRLEELNLKGYIEANRLEAEHSPKAREEFLKAFNDWVYRERRRGQTSSA